jgi:hypothetical protein
LKNVSIYIIAIAIFILSCDSELFKTEEEPLAPVVGEIQTSLSNFTIFAGDSATFWVEASNPGEGSLAYDWNISAGEFLTSPDQDNIKWRAPFSGGIQTIEIEVSNNDRTTTKRKEVEVVSLDIPVVNILYPKEDSYLVQYETIELEAEAFHDNGISYVEFVVNDSSLGIIDGNATNRYTDVWLNNAPAGRAEIEVVAVARSAGTEGMDRIQVYIEGVVPGKK